MSDQSEWRRNRGGGPDSAGTPPDSRAEDGDPSEEDWPEEDDPSEGDWQQMDPDDWDDAEEEGPDGGNRTDGTNPAGDEIVPRLATEWAYPPVGDDLVSNARLVTDSNDVWFGVACFLMGYFFMRWIVFDDQSKGFCMGFFTFAFLNSATAYLLAKGIKPTAESIWWYVCVSLTALATLLYDGHSLAFFRTAFIWLAFSGMLVSATGNARHGVIPDAFNGLFIAPMRNLSNLYRTLGGYPGDGTGEAPPQSRAGLGTIAGGVIAGLVLIIATSPLLFKADAGSFQDFVGGLVSAKDILFILLGVPAGVWFFAFVSGFAHSRRIYAVDNGTGNPDLHRFLPASFFTIATSILTVWYMLFVFYQLPDIAGMLAKGGGDAFSYSEYARRGFVELCALAVINLAIYYAPKIFARERVVPVAVKTLNCLLCALTVILIIIASLKMHLYISNHGFTLMRLYPMAGMLFLASAFVFLAAGQYTRFNLTRLTSFVGALLFCAIVLSNPDSWVCSYNANRFLEGSLEEFDTGMLDDSGFGGVSAAVGVYGFLDQEGKEQVRAYLARQRALGADSFESVNAKKQIEDFFRGSP